MGLPPLGGHAHHASESFGVIDASKVLNWEPIVSIGLRTWRPTSDYLGLSQRSAPSRQRRPSEQRHQQEQTPVGVGEPLFANNVHAWSF